MVSVPSAAKRTGGLDKEYAGIAGGDYVIDHQFPWNCASGDVVEMYALGR